MILSAALEQAEIADPDLELKRIHDGGSVAVRRDDVRGWRVVFLRPGGAG